MYGFTGTNRQTPGVDYHRTEGLVRNEIKLTIPEVLEHSLKRGAFHEAENANAGADTGSRGDLARAGQAGGLSPHSGIAKGIGRGLAGSPKGFLHAEYDYPTDELWHRRSGGSRGELPTGQEQGDLPNFRTFWRTLAKPL